MSQHPDDGTIQMLLDDELDRGERARLEAHVATCEVCAARVAEARAYQREADRLVEVVQVPEGRLTIPPRRRTVAPLRTLAWAASILLAVGVGYWGRGTVAPTPPMLQEGDRPGSSTTPATAHDAAQPAPPAAAPPSADSTAVGKVSRPASSAGGVTDGRRRQGAAQEAEAKPLAKREEAKQVAQAPAAPSVAANDAALDAGAAFARSRDDGVTAIWRVVPLEEAVRTLGGQLRLIDGMVPERLESGPGTAVAGAEPGLPVVRVVYAAGAVLLDQQRPIGGESLREAVGAARAAAAPGAAPPPAWRQAGGIRYVVTGNLSVDSLAALTARVR